jgi:copper transport protein
MIIVGLPIGLIGVVLPVFRRLDIDRLPVLASARRGVLAAVIVMLAGAVALFIAQVMPLELEFDSPMAWMEFVQLSLLGQMLIARLGLGLVALIALLWMIWQRAGQNRSIGALVVCALIGFAAQATITRTSHSAAMDAGWMPVAADFAHLFAGALWGGGLVAVIIAVHHVRRTNLADERGAVIEASRALIRRFSPLAILGVSLAAGTGVALTSVHVGDADALRTSDYGRLILLKIGLATLAIALAAWHKFVTWRRMNTLADVRRFSHRLLIEASLVFGIFAGAAWLTSTSPPHHTVIHHMADGTSHMMMIADPDFQRLLLIAALAILSAGIVAVVLEWRDRLSSTQR